MSDVRLRDVHVAIERLWPASFAESWDQIGLVVGDNDAIVNRVLLAVDAVHATVAEAASYDADLLLTHHPLLLRGIHSVAGDTSKGSIITSLIRQNCALIAAHTNADVSAGGVSDVLARAFGLSGSMPIQQTVSEGIGVGRVGTLISPMSLATLAEKIAHVLPDTVSGVRVAGDPERLISNVALCGGAGDSLLSHPAVRSADVYVTSDLRHHSAQEALELAEAVGGPALIDVSHWASESLWLRVAQQQLAEAFPAVEFLVSESSTEPWMFRV